ncbi:MAG: hypothetical protein U1D35_17100 [Paracoccaceae bacterium]|nr:hypothetical protein [Paracoccaceae bacterium]
MTDRIALILGALLVVAMAVDILANSGAALIFLGQKLAGLVEYLAFWR